MNLENDGLMIYYSCLGFDSIEEENKNPCHHKEYYLLCLLIAFNFKLAQSKSCDNQVKEEDPIVGQ